MPEHKKAQESEKLSSPNFQIAKDSSCPRENNTEDVSSTVVFLNRLTGITNHTLGKSNFYTLIEIICFGLKREGCNHMFA